MRKLILTFVLLLTHSFMVTAQATNEMQSSSGGNIMEQEGKIYVVLGVCLIILAGLIGYLFVLDRRISRLEQKKD